MGKGWTEEWLGLSYREDVGKGRGVGEALRRLWEVRTFPGPPKGSEEPRGRQARDLAGIGLWRAGKWGSAVLGWGPRPVLWDVSTASGSSFGSFAHRDLGKESSGQVGAQTCFPKEEYRQGQRD